MSQAMNIGEAAAAAGVSAKMIRHYEQIGLVPPAARTDSGYRQYTERDVSILRFVRQARHLGFSMEQIAELLGLWGDSGRASSRVKALAQRHVDDLDAKMREMAEMKAALEGLVVACAGDDRPHCRILDGLAVGSTAQPAPGLFPGAPVLDKRRARGTSGRTRPERRASAAEPSYLGLMAWTRSVRDTHAGQP